MMRQQWLVFLPMTLATAGLAACASMMGERDVKVRPIESKPAQASIPHDPVYESAVSAINDRDYGRALDYLQAAKAKDPANVKILNALGVVYDKLGRFDLSARYYAQARAIEPESKIVAENMGYSRILQRLMDPGAPVAVASIDMPPLLPASPAQPSPAQPVTSLVAPAEKPIIAAAPVIIQPAPVLPEARQVAGRTVMFASAPTPTMTAPVIIEPAPVLPEARQVAGRSVMFASAAAPAMTAPSLPPMEIIPAPPVQAAAADLPSLLAKPATPVLAKAETLTAAPPVTVMPAALPVQSTIAPHLVMVVPPTRQPMIPAVTVTLPAMMETDPNPVLARSEQAATTVAMPPPVQKKVAAPSILPSRPFELPVLKPETLPVIAATDPVPMVESKPVMLAAVPALPVSSSPKITPVPAVPTVVKAMEPAAPKAVTVVPVPVAAPAPAKKPVLAMAVPAPQHKRPVLAASAAPKPVIAMTAPAQKLPAIVAPAAPQPIKLAVAHPAPAVPAEKSVVRTLRDMLAALLPARSPVQQVAAAAKPVKAPSVFKPVRVAIAAARPDNAPMAPANPPAARTVLTIGQPVKLLNASGKPSGTATVLRRLATLGWTMRASEARAQPASVLFYSAQNFAAAQALQRTLPFPVRLTVDKAYGAGMRLVIGRDYLSWKPRNAHIAALWQKSAVIASLQKPIKGER